MTEEMKERPLEAMLASGAIETENRSRAEAEGRISQVLLKDGNYTIILEPATVRAGGTQYEEKRLMISAKESRDGAVPEEGMYLHAKGKAELFQEARNPGEFDYRLYYRSQKLRCRLRADKMEIISGERPAFQSQLIMFRRFVKEALAFLYQEEDRGIFQAVLLGDKSSMDSDIRELYQDGGIAHVLAVSGVKTLKLDIPLVPETRIKWALMPLHIAKIYILKLCLDEEIIPRCRFPCSRGYLTKCINQQKKQ